MTRKCKEFDILDKILVYSKYRLCVIILPQKNILKYFETDNNEYKNRQ